MSVKFNHAVRLERIIGSNIMFCLQNSDVKVHVTKQNRWPSFSQKIWYTCSFCSNSRHVEIQIKPYANKRHVCHFYWEILSFTILTRKTDVRRVDKPISVCIITPVTLCSLKKNEAKIILKIDEEQNWRTNSTNYCCWNWASNWDQIKIAAIWLQAALSAVI